MEECYLTWDVVPIFYIPDFQSGNLETYIYSTKDELVQRPWHKELKKISKSSLNGRLDELELTELAFAFVIFSRFQKQYILEN